MFIIEWGGSGGVCRNPERRQTSYKARIRLLSHPNFGFKGQDGKLNYYTNKLDLRDLNMPASFRIVCPQSL